MRLSASYLPLTCPSLALSAVLCSSLPFSATCSNSPSFVLLCSLLHCRSTSDGDVVRFRNGAAAEARWLQKLSGRYVMAYYGSCMKGTVRVARVDDDQSLVSHYSSFVPALLFLCFHYCCFIAALSLVLFHYCSFIVVVVSLLFRYCCVT